MTTTMAMATTDLDPAVIQADLASHTLFASGDVLTSSILVSEVLPSLQRQASALDARVTRARNELQVSVRNELDDIERILAETSFASDAKKSIPVHITAVDEDLSNLASLFDSNDTPAQGPAVNELQSQLDALDDLYAARSYYRLLAHADALSESVVAADKGEGISEGEDGKELALRRLLDHSALVLRAMNTWLWATPSEEPQLLGYLRAQLLRTYETSLQRRSEALAIALSDAGWPVSTVNDENVTGQKYDAQVVRAREREILQDFHVREAWFDLCSLQRLGDGSLWPDEATRTSQLLFSPPASSVSSAPDGPSAGTEQFVPLLPSRVIFQPTLQRFAYHFDTDHASNRLDKPEWWMRHLLDILAHHLALWRPSAQDQGSVSHLYALGGYGQADTVEELVHVVLSTARAKIEASMPLLLDHPNLLAHTLLAALDFDAELTEVVASVPPPEGHVRPAPIRLGHVMLEKDQWFESWLNGEKHHAFHTFESNLSARHAWRITLADGTADDERDPIVTGPVLSPSGTRAPLPLTTISSCEVVELLEHITALYRPLLPSPDGKTLLHRYAFWDQVQRPLVTNYLSTLKSALDTFESSSSVFARHIPGAMLGGEPAPRPGIDEAEEESTPSIPTRGPAGVQRLCAIYVSAYYLRASLALWSSQGFFVELSHDLLARGIAPDTTIAQQGGGLTGLLKRGIESSKQAAGALRPLTVRTDSNPDPRAPDSGLWAGLVDEVTVLEQRASDAIRKLVVGEVSEATAEYSRRSWVEAPDGFEAAEPEPDTVPTASLLPALTTLSGHLDQLTRTLSAPGIFLPVYRSIAQGVSDMLLDRVVLMGGSRRFDYTGSKRFRADLQQGWFSVVHDVAFGARGKGINVWGRNPEAAWRSIRQISTLLALPPDPEGVSIVPGRGVQGRPWPPEQWTIADAIYAAFDYDPLDDQRGFPALAHAIGGFEAGSRLAREVLRRRVECLR